jgi:hypothetical protein
MEIGVERGVVIGEAEGCGGGGEKKKGNNSYSKN